MKFTIFYSWQSDLSNNTNRSFIEKALKNSIKNISEIIKLEPVIDRDTIGIGGSPEIAKTIFSKIASSQIFVCDVSIINISDTLNRFTPNPNVLIELGYAMKALGSNRVIIILNTAFGNPEQLPFDLRLRRVITYHLPEGHSEINTERKKLEKKLDLNLKTIIKDIDITGTYTINIPDTIAPHLKQAIIALDNPSSNIRSDALESLSNTSDFNARNVLIEILNHPLPDVRIGAALELTKDGNEQSISVLIEALYHKKIVDENKIKDAFVKIGKPAVPYLCDALHSSNDEWVRQNIVSILGNIGDPSAVSDIICLLLDKDATNWSNENYIKALGEIGDSSAINGLLDIYHNETDERLRKSVFEELSGECYFSWFGRQRRKEGIIDPKIVPEIINGLEDKNEDIRIFAIRALGKLKEISVVPKLLSILRNDNDKVSAEAAKALGEIGEQSAIDALIEALENDDVNIKKMAIEALGEIGNPNIIEKLIPFLKNSGTYIRISVARALGKLKNPIAIPHLIRMLSDFDSIGGGWTAKEWVCKVAAESLEIIGTPEAKAAVKEFRLNYPDK